VAPGWAVSVLRPSLLARSSLRTLTRHPWQLVLAVLGVALGVAVVVAIQLANGSSRRAFALSTEAVSGRATHQIVGGPEGLPGELFTRLRREVPALPAAPVVEAWASTPAAPGRLFRLLGLDPFAEAPFRPHLAGVGTTGVDLATFMTRPGAVLLAGETAAELGLAVGDPLPLVFAGRRVEAFLAGTLAGTDAGGASASRSDGREALAEWIVADVATAQELLGCPPSGRGGQGGSLSRIDLLLPADGARRKAFLDRLGELLPPGAEVVRSRSRTRTVEEMTRAFHLNLSALALLALVCGAFLIYNTMTFSVVRRRELIGSLRALGVLRREIFRLVLTEAAVIGAVGTALGLGLGVLLSRGLVRLVARTINDLYFTLNVRGVSVDPRDLALGAVLGMGATLLAALHPAWEATRAPPRAVLSRSMLEEARRRGVPRAAGAGLVLGALGGALLLVPVKGLIPAFAGLFAVLLGCALLAPAATVLLARLARPVLGATVGILGRMAAGGVIASLSRTGVAIATLMITVSVTLGVGVMIDSFRGTVVRWLEGTLVADVYLSAPGPHGGVGAGPIPEELAAAVGRIEGVERVNTLVAFSLVAEGVVTELRALDLDARGREAFDLKRGDGAELWPAFEAGEAVLISEPLAYRRDLAVGDSLTLPTARGPRSFRVGGIFYDYANDRGAVVLSRRAFEAGWAAPGFTALAVFAAPGVEAESLLPALRREVAASGIALEIRPARRLKEISLAIFDRTFAITGVLRLLAGVVAFIGVLAALMALQLERGRELGVLRANGLTPRQVWGLVTSQTGLMGGVAGLLSIPVGWVMAAIMIEVINRRSFGWTIEMEVAPSLPLESLALALVAALLAGLYPAWRMSRTSPARALREE